MASVFTHGERGWTDKATPSYPTTDASSFLQLRPSQRLSQEFSAAASPLSPSLDDLRARLHDVMRSIDDTLNETDAPPHLQLVSATTPAVAAPHPALPSGRRGSFHVSERAGLSHRPPAHPAQVVGPSTASASSASPSSSPVSSTPASPGASRATWPLHRLVADGASDAAVLAQSAQHPPQQREHTLVRPPSATISLVQAGASDTHDAVKQPDPLPESSWRLNGTPGSDRDEDSAATGLSATYKATLDFWHACGPRTLQRATTAGARESVNPSAAALRETATRWAPAAPVASALSSLTTVSKYSMPTARERLMHGSVRGGEGEGDARLYSANSETLTSTDVTTARTSRSHSSSASFANSARGVAVEPWKSDTTAFRNGVGAPSGVATTHIRQKDVTVSPTKAREENFSVHPGGRRVEAPSVGPGLAPLPHPSTVPSLSARLAVLRATDAMQRHALQQRDGVNWAAQGPIDGTGAVDGEDQALKGQFLPPFSPTRKGEARAFADPCVDTGLFPRQTTMLSAHTSGTAAAVHTPLAQRTSSHHDSDFYNRRSNSTANNNNTNNINNRNVPVDGSHTNACGVNESHHSDVLVRSPDAARVTSPGSADRRTRREVRQGETSYIVALAMERQTAAEEAWRSGRPQLRPAPSRPLSAPAGELASARMHGSPQFNTRTLITGGVGGGDERLGGTPQPITTAPLDALQARLTPSKLTEDVAGTVALTAAQGSSNSDASEGQLPMREELAVRARLAARRSGQGAHTGSREEDQRLRTREKDAEVRVLQLQWDRYQRLSDARDRDAALHLHEEMARHTTLQAEARARVARVHEKVPATSTSAVNTEELRAIRAHAEQLEKLRLRMQGAEVAIPSPHPAASPQQPLNAQGSHWSVSSSNVAALHDATPSSASSSLNIPEVSPSIPNSVNTSPSKTLKQPQRVATDDAAVPPTRPSTRPPHAAREHHSALSTQPKTTSLSTAAALTSVSVEVGDESDESLSSVSATSVEEREVTPERAVSPQVKDRSSGAHGRAAASSQPPNGVCAASSAEERHHAQPEESAVLRSGTASADAEQQRARARRHHTKHASTASSGSEGEDDDSTNVVHRDWATSTQLPSSRPPRQAFASKDDAKQQRHPQQARRPAPQRKASPAAVARAESNVSPARVDTPRADHHFPAASSRLDEPPSPLPTKPAAAQALTRQGRGTNTREDLAAALPAHTAARRTDGQAKAPHSPSPRASLPVVDVERDIVSSSPSAGRESNQRASHVRGESERSGFGSLTPERLAGIQSVRLHVSPVRGGAWRSDVASAHPHYPAMSNASPSPSSSLSSSSSSSALPSVLARSPVALKPSSTLLLQEAPARASLGSAPPSSSSPTRGPSSRAQPSAHASSPPPAAAAAAPVKRNPLLAHQQAMQREANRRTVFRAQAILAEHGVSVEVQLAGRRLPALVKRSSDGAELLFYLERVAEAESPASTPPRGRSLATPPLSSATSAVSEQPTSMPPRTFSSQRLQQPQQVRPDGTGQAPMLAPGAVPGGARGAKSFPCAPDRAAEPSVGAPSSLHPSAHPLQQHAQHQTGALYSVAPSVRLHEATPTPPKSIAGPPPGFVKVPVGMAPMQRPDGHFNSASSPRPPQVNVFASGGALPSPAAQRTSPARFGPPPPPSKLLPTRVSHTHPSNPPSTHVAAPPHASHLRPSSPPVTRHRPSSPTAPPTQQRQQTPSRTMRVRERHHFPCSNARVYAPYGVMGSEADCGLGGPHTWEDVCGVLCGPASYEVLRRYGCPLFARMRGSGYAPYRVYVIIPEFRRIDIPQDAVLLVLDFKQRVDWVLFLLAMQRDVTDRDGRAGAMNTLSWDGGAEDTVSTPRTAALPPPVMSYGRALWILAVQRLQRARALRGLNPFESHSAARHSGVGASPTTPSRQRSRALLMPNERRELRLAEPPGKEDADIVKRRQGNGQPQRSFASGRRTLSPGPTAASLRFAAPATVAAPTPSRVTGELRHAPLFRHPHSSQPAPPTNTAAAAAAAIPTVGNRRGFVDQPLRSVNRVASREPRPAAAAPEQKLTVERPVLQTSGGDGSLHEYTHPLYAEEMSKPRFRWLKRVTSSLNSSRRSSSAAKKSLIEMN